MDQLSLSAWGLRLLAKPENHTKDEEIASYKV
jgi:hypothetical protein